MQRATLLLVSCTCLGAQPAAIEGVAVNQATGQPMPGVHVRLTNLVSNSDAQPYGAMSGPTGQFSIASVPAGNYYIEATLRGFYLMPPKGENAAVRVSLKPGQRLTDYKIEMAQEAIISGRVLDENGDPVETGVRAEAERGQNTRGWATTDERGEFRISVPPGKYYLVTNEWRRGGPAEIRTDGSSDASYAETYYPGSTVKAKSELVEATAGAELAGMDMHLVRQPRALSISGVVTGGTDAPFGIYVTVEHDDDARHRDLAGNTGTMGNGRFRFDNLQPGAYKVYATLVGASSEATRLYSLPASVRLESGDVTGVNLALAPGGEITGKLEVAGGPGAEKRTVVLEGFADPFIGGSLVSSEVDASGAFHFKDLAPRRYRLKVAPMPDNAYLKSVRLDGVEATDGELDFSRGVQGSVAIVMSRNGGQISGKLLDKNGEPVGAEPVMVFLIADPNDINFERSLKESEDGAYRLQGIRPGKYRLVALDRLDFAAVDSHEFEETIKKFATAAEEIEIKEGDRKVKDLKLPVKEDADAKQAQ